MAGGLTFNMCFSQTQCVGSLVVGRRSGDRLKGARGGNYRHLPIFQYYDLFQKTRTDFGDARMNWQGTLKNLAL